MKVLAMDEVYFVLGDEDNLLFAHKIDAEGWARYLFPEEDARKRYQRIGSLEVH